MSNGEFRPTSTLAFACLLLALSGGVLFFHKLGTEDVSSESEARVLLTAAEMNRSKTWIIPTVGGEDRWEKPPLYVWGVKLVSMFNGGRVTPFVGRLPGAICAMLLVFLGAWWAYQHFTRYPREDFPDLKPEIPGLLTGLLLVSCPEIFNIAREGIADSMFAFLCFAALYCFGESFEMRRSFYASHPWRYWVLAGYFLMGLAMMTKGPVVFLFVLIPYIATCFSYRMRRPDWIHLAGVFLAAVIGGWWYVTAALIDPDAWPVFMKELIKQRFGPNAASREPIHYYFALVGKFFFPWNLLAFPLAYQALARRRRTPTRELWSWSLVAGIAWLSMVGSKNREYFVPVAPFIPLLAGDALAHWDFDSRWGKAFRALIRTIRWLAILAAIPISIWISSEWGMGLSIGLGVACFLFLFHRRQATHVYAWWERTMQGAWFLAIVFLSVEAVYIQDYIPWKNLTSPVRGFAAQMQRHLRERAELHILGDDCSALYSYYLGRVIPIAKSLNDEKIPLRTGSYLLSDRKVQDLLDEPRLAPIVLKWDGTPVRAKTALFKVAFNADSPTTTSLETRFAGISPLHLAVIGDAGRDREIQREVARRIGEVDAAAPLDGIISVGDAFSGETLLQRLDIFSSFWHPYRRLIREGIPFHGVVGENDRALGNLAVSFRGMLMAGRTYYARDLRKGLLRFYALDDHALSEESLSQNSEPWEWLTENLERSGARWKIVAIHSPLISLTQEEDARRAELAARLFPLLDRNGVQLVLWAGDPWYVRIEDPAHRPVMIGAGWSGGTRPADFRPDPRLKASSDAQAGILELEASPESLKFRAIGKDGGTVDQGVLHFAE